MANTLGAHMPKSRATAGERAPAGATAGRSMFAGLGGMFGGKPKGKEKDEPAGNEAELTGSGVADDGGASVRRRAAAATAQASM